MFARHATKLLGLSLLLTACSPRVHPFTEGRRQTEWRDRYHLDSVYLRDSVVVSMFALGDTVYKTKEVYHWGDRLRIDTINTGRIDSVRLTERIEVPAKLTAWQSWQLKAFAPLVAIALILGAWVTRKLWIPLLRGLIG